MTNEVACAATAAPATVSEAVSQQVDQGREFMQQVMTWFTQNGLGFATKLVIAIVILVDLNGQIADGRKDIYDT